MPKESDMPYSRELESVNRATLLRLIRDNEATTCGELIDRICPKPDDADRSPFFQVRLQYMHLLVIRAVEEFEQAGLITKDSRDLYNGKLAPTPLIQKVQLALDINLHDLSRAGSDTTLLNPIFGKPKEVATSDIFVLMPFSDDLLPVYQDHIRSTAEDVGLSISRADDVFATSSIIADIWQAINNCKLVIADCTGRNPNVFYEIGIAHTVGKPTVLITQSMDDIPFDLRHIRCIVYKYTPRGMTQFDDALKKTLESEFDKLTRTNSGI
jgi:hypothetical protein